MDRRYPEHPEVIDCPDDLDGYVAATHHPHSISANAFELRDRQTDEPLSQPEVHVSRSISTQDRGILWGIIGLLEMSGENSRLDLYTTSENVVKSLRGEYQRSKNLELLEEIFRITSKKKISVEPYYVTAAQPRRSVVVEKLRLLAKAARDEWLKRNPG